MGEFTMPSLGADMDAGTVTRWLVQPGDHVRRGDVVAEVETDKSTIEVEVFEDGVIDRLVIDEGERVPVGTTLALIASEPSDLGISTTPSAVSPQRPDSTGIVAHPVGAPAGGGARPPRPSSSPRARALAHELGVDLTTLIGSGPGGSIVEDDVRRAAAGTLTPSRPGAPAASATDRSAVMQRAIGELMARSKREIPHYYLSTTVDLQATSTWLEQANLERPIEHRLVMSALLLRATVLAIGRVPEMNGFFQEGSFVPGDVVHLGVAISLRSGGVIAPAIRDAGQLSADQLMLGLRELVGRARRGVLRSSEIASPTITVTDLGEQGVEEVFGVIYPPQVALVGFGRVNERAVVVDGTVRPRPCVTVTLAADHRVSDGHLGSRFLSELDRLLQHPGSL